MRDRKVLAAILCLVILCSSLSALIAYDAGVKAQSSALTMQTHTSGPQPGAPSYTIFTDGTTYYAKDAYGAIAYSSTNCSSTVQSIITAGAGKIEFGLGTFPLHGIIIPALAFIIIEGVEMKTMGEGGGGTTLSLDANANMFSITGTTPYTGYGRNIVFQNLRFYGGAYSGNFLHAVNTHLVTIQQCTFSTFTSAVIFMEACWEWTIKDNFFTQCGTANSPTATAIIYMTNGDNAAGQSNGIHIESNTFDFLGDVLYSDGSGDSIFKYNSVIWFTNNWVHGQTTTAPRPDSYPIEGNFTEATFSGNNYVYSELGFIKLLSGSHRITITNERMTNMGSYPIYLDGTVAQANTIISNNNFEFHGAGETGDANQNGLIYSFDWQGIIAQGNYAETGNKGSLRLFYGGAEQVISGYVLHDLLNNYKFFSEVSGSASGTSPITITHYLANEGGFGRNAPTLVLITDKNTTSSRVMYSYGASGTQLLIYFNGTDVRTFDYRMEYHP